MIHKLTPATKRFKDMLTHIMAEAANEDINSRINDAIEEGLHMSDTELAAILKLKVGEVKRRRSVIMFKRTDNIIKRNFNMPVKELAALCGLSEAAVSMRKSRLKRRGNYGHPQTEETKNKIRDSLTKN